MVNVRKAFAYWWRGWSDDDLSSARAKIAKHTAPGDCIPLTAREFSAVRCNDVVVMDDPYLTSSEADRENVMWWWREGMPEHLKPTEQDTIDSIFAIRVANNVPWKRLMEIALKYAPEETRAVLREINANDLKVSELLGELAK